MSASEFRKLSNEELLKKTQVAAQNEKMATLILLDYLAEVDRRRLYAECGYSSLFKYVHKGLGYSEAQSSERISSMRLMKRVPEVKEALKTEKLTLTSAAKLASHVRREKTDESTTLMLLKKCEGKSTRDVERVLVSYASLENGNNPTPRPDRLRAVSEELTQITFDADSECLLLLKRIQELNGDPTESVRAIFKTAMREYIRIRERKRGLCEKGVIRESRRNASRAPEVQSVKRDSGLAEGTISKLNTVQIRNEQSVASRNRYLPIATRRELFKRAENRCEYVDCFSKRRCESRYRLEIDHIRPLAHGGDKHPNNLRVVCRAHNLMYAIQAFGEKKIQPFLRN